MLRDREDLRSRCREILEGAKEKDRSLTNEENNEIDKAMVAIKTLDLDISEREAEVRADMANMTGGYPINRPMPLNSNDYMIYAKGQRVSDYHRPEENERLSLGRYIKGALTGDWKGGAQERDAFKAMSTGTGKVLIPAPLSAEIIDLARNKSVLFNGGVPLIEMTTNNLTMAKVAEDPVFGFKEELEKVEPVGMAFAPVELKAKTAYGLVRVSLELLHSAQNLGQVLRDSMAAAIANLIDQKCLFGDDTDDTEPKGILTYDTINEVAVTDPLVNYDPFVEAVSKIRQANGEPTTWVINAATDGHLNVLVDGIGQPLNQYKVLDGLHKEISNQLPANGGVGGDESTALVFDPRAIAIGMQVPIILQASDTAGDAYERGAVYLRIFSMLDVCLLQPKHVSLITGLKEKEKEIPGQGVG